MTCKHCKAKATYDSPEDLCEFHWFTTFWLKKHSKRDLRLLLEDAEVTGTQRTAAEQLLAEKEDDEELL